MVILQGYAVFLCVHEKEHKGAFSSRFYGALIVYVLSISEYKELEKVILI